MAALIVLAAGLWVCSVPTPALSQGLRTDTDAATLGGTAVLVLDSGDVPAPGAIIYLSEPTKGVSITTVTDDAGRFVVGGLPSGRYVLRAAKAGFITTNYRARRPADPGVVLVLDPGQKRIDLVLSLRRGSAIGGVVRDHSGRTRPSALVGIVEIDPDGSKRPLLEFMAETDEQGRYRIHGLPAGSYLVEAGPRFGSDSVARPIRNADAQALTAGYETVGWPRVFYPSALDPGLADPIRLNDGEERANIDITLQLAPVVNVSGSVFGLKGDPAAADVQIIRNGWTGVPGMPGIVRTGDDGRLLFRGVTAGRYEIIARARWPMESAQLPAAGSSSSADARFLWARGTINVTDQDLRDVNLQLRPATSLTGIVTSDVSLEPSKYRGAELELIAVDPTPMTPVRIRTTVTSQGSFAFPNVPPGRYRLRPTAFNERVWVVQSAIARGIDIVDEPVDLPAGVSPPPVVVAVTVSAELTGRLLDPSGAPAFDTYVLIFPVAEEHWTATNRRVRLARPDSNAVFAIPDLLPGEYWVCGISDIRALEANLPKLLSEAKVVARRITLRSSERFTLDLMVGGKGSDGGFPVASERMVGHVESVPSGFHGLAPHMSSNGPDGVSTAHSHSRRAWSFPSWGPAVWSVAVRARRPVG